MSNFTIDCRDTAVEAAQQYRELGLPMPIDLIAYLEADGFIVTDPSDVDGLISPEENA